MNNHLSFLGLLCLIIMLGNVNLVNSEPMYSVIGNNWDCSIYPEKSMELGFGENLSIEEASINVCGNKNALINTYNSNWAPHLEYKNETFKCIFEEGCFVEIYCCPHAECETDEDCNKIEGQQSKCETKFCNPWKEGYRCDIQELERGIPYQHSRVNHCTKNSDNSNYFVWGILIVVLIFLYIKKRKSQKI